LLKDTRIREQLNLQFRAEIFNLLKPREFQLAQRRRLYSSGPSPTAGVITSTSTTSRQVQFSLKLLW